MTQVSQSQSPVRLATAPAVSPAMSTAANVPSQAQYAGGHLTARGRRVLAVMALVPLVLAMVLTNTHRAAANGTAPTSTQVVVHPGESLWDIAVAVDPNTDPRKTMWEIQQLNHMTTSRLDAGQGLLVPVR